MSPSSLMLRFRTSAATLEAHYDGQLVVHTLAKNQSHQHLLSVVGGPHPLATLAAIELVAVHGECHVTVAGRTRRLAVGKPSPMPAATTFEVRSADFSQIMVTSESGPALAAPPVETCVLR